MKQRILTLDGLRCLAAIGVLWIHTWTACGYPRFKVGPIDLADILALGGNGVDLFFVISGFCMYYFYAGKSNFSYRDFYRFIVKRWVRLSPAFYMATIIYLLVSKFIYNKDINGVLNFLHSLFYLNHIFVTYTTASHFWTLTVEWQFYFIIPLLLIYQNSIGFKKTFLIIFGFIIIVAAFSVFITTNRYDLLTDTILFREVQFACGIVAARLLLKNNIIARNRGLWLFLFIIITYAGRVCISQRVLVLSTNYYNLFKLAGFTLMGCGFAGILLLSVTSVKWLNLVLGNKAFKSLGKVSYSFYLLHVLIFPAVARYVISQMAATNGILIPILATIISALIIYPLALISFNLFEKPFLAAGNLTTR